MTEGLTRRNSTSPTMSEVIVEAIYARMADLHTGLPAKVVTFDEVNQACDVQPLLLRAILNDDDERITEEIPQITNVPIHYPSGGGWSLIFPLVVDDIVFLTFAERSMDRWLDGAPGQQIDPEHARRHDLTDAVCIPGIRPRTSPIAELATVGSNCRLGRDTGGPAVLLKPDGTIEIGASSGTIIIQPDGTIKLGPGATQPLLLGEVLIGLLASHTHPFVGVLPLAPGVTLPTTTVFDPAKSAKGKVE